MENICIRAVASGLFAASALADNPFPAHRVAGIVYYVGSEELATYLVPALKGYILINSGFKETVSVQAIRAPRSNPGFGIDAAHTATQIR